MKRLLAFLISGCFAACAFAQGCEGGLYLNPQVIRGEGSVQTDSTLRELVEFLRPSGLSVSPVTNVRDVQEVAAAIARPTPPCWVYGNPVVGLASGYRPAAINTETIEAAVLILGDAGDAKDARALGLEELPAPERIKVLARLKSTSCYGMKSGVTTALVQTAGLCGTVIEVTPQQGLGQSYLPTKAAFNWQADHWVGLVTRLQAAQAATMKNHHGTDARIHGAQLLVVPAPRSSWGYGLYTHPALPADAARKAAALFFGLKTASPLLLKALDLGSRFEFASPPDAAIGTMRKALGLAPRAGGGAGRDLP